MYLLKYLKTSNICIRDIFKCNDSCKPTNETTIKYKKILYAQKK